MIRRKDSPKEEKTPFLLGLFLLIISVILKNLTLWLGVIYSCIRLIVKGDFKHLGEYFLQIAISIDQLGNVVMQHILNDTWKVKGGYPFGNRDETISSALGKNQENGTLSKSGEWVTNLLDKVDPNHALNSIDYNIEPDFKET